MEKRNRRIVLTMFVAALTFIFMFGGRLPFALFYLSVALPLFSLAYVIYVYARFKYTMDVGNKTVIKGDVVNFTVNVQNEDLILYPYMSLNLLCADTLLAHFTETRHFSLPPRSRKSFIYQIECMYRGKYELGVENICIRDLLCVFKLRYRPRENRYIIVYPRIVPLERFNITRRASEDETLDAYSASALDNSVVSDIREYNYGDPLNKVHWKLTARLGEMQVRNFKASATDNSLIIIDAKKLNRGKLECVIAEDKLIEAATSVMYFYYNNNLPLNIVYFDTELHEIKSGEAADFEVIHKEMAILQFHQNATTEPIFAERLNRSAEKTNVILFSYNIDGYLYDKLIDAKNAGFNVTLVALNLHTADFDTVVYNLRQGGVAVYTFGIDDDIKAALES